MTRVVVTGVPRSGARTLAHAIAAVDGSLSVAAVPAEALAARWIPTADDTLRAGY